mmetsp:Transcript_4529/g.11256  ORF Transcript_4529/g.11256 Transcript_4529/m.11256 type:complete len:116 (-) Transcript_4529:152-499(-)
MSTTSSLARASLRDKHEGPSKLIERKGYGSSMALSVLRNLLVAKQLRSGDGVISTPASRRKERLFGTHGTGRVTLISKGTKIEKLGDDYNPREDTCIAAFVRLMGELACARAEAM